MNAPVAADEFAEPVQIRRLELCQRAEVQNRRNNRVTPLELLQHFSVGRVAGFGFLDGRQLQAHEQHIGKLFGRIDVERFARKLVNAALKSGNAFGHFGGFFLELSPVDEDAAIFHAGKHDAQRQFHVAIKFRQVRVGKQFFVAGGGSLQRVDISAEFRVANRPVAFGIQQVGGKLRVENFINVRDVEVVQKSFHVAQKNFAREAVEHALNVVGSRRKNFPAENFHGVSFGVAAGNRDNLRGKNFVEVNRQLDGLNRRRRRRGAEQVYLAEKRVNFFLDLRERVTVAEFVGAGNVGRDCEARGVECDVRHVADDLRKMFARRRGVGLRRQQVANFFRRDLVAAGKDVFQLAESFNQRRGSFRTDTLDARNVVGSVAAQALEVDKQCGRESVFAEKFFRVVKLGVGFFCQQDVCRRVD